MFGKVKKEDWISVGKGAAIAGAGAALAYIAGWASGQDFGIMGPALTAGLSVAVNFFRKLATAPKSEDFDLFAR